MSLHVVLTSEQIKAWTCCLCQFIATSDFDLETHIDNRHSDIFRTSKDPFESKSAMEGQNLNNQETKNNFKNTKNKRKRQIPQHQPPENQVKIFKCVILGIARTNLTNLNI